MSEKVLGIIGVFGAGFGKIINENLIITSDRVIVARKASMSSAWGLVGGAVGATVGALIERRKAQRKDKEHREMSLYEILHADKNNYAIPNSDITEVKLKRTWGGGTELEIKTIPKQRVKGKPALKKKAKWSAAVKWEDVAECEKMLRPIFEDRLSIKD